MIEFGSDFHRCDSSFYGLRTIDTLYPSRQFYGCGRMAMSAIIRQNGWKRMWVPSYFCYEVLEIWKQNIDICLYDDYPLENHDDEIVRTLPFQQGDVLLRMNFFGLRSYRGNEGIPVPVIEDHSHSLTSEWALHSNADWCFASLRKSLPLAYGGILWSPKGLTLPPQPAYDASYNQLAEERYNAMTLKTKYLLEGGDKERFRAKYIATEEGLDKLHNIAALDQETEGILHQLDIIHWNEQKQKNWQLACRLLERFDIIGRDHASSPFSIIVLMTNKTDRDQFKAFLIQHSIFPATLWEIPENIPFAQSKDFGERMLSIHCDARYKEKDIQQMCNIINQYDSTH